MYSFHSDNHGTFNGKVLLLLLLGLLTVISCKDDDENQINADINTPITGCWTLGGSDFRYANSVIGLLVHNDGTVSEWQYSDSDAVAPLKLQYKDSKWEVKDNHYEMWLSDDNGSYYIVSVEGNNGNEMVLSFNNTTSAVHFYRNATLPENCKAMTDYLISPIDESLRGRWGRAHYTWIEYGDTITDIDVEPGDWTTDAMYHWLEFNDDHTVTEYNRDGSVWAKPFFRYDSRSQTLTTSNEINSLFIPTTDYIGTYTVAFPSSSEMVLTRTTLSDKTIYTYRKQ